MHFCLPLYAYSASQAIADHYQISVAALYRLALEQFCENNPAIGDDITLAIKAGNARIRNLSAVELEHRFGAAANQAQTLHTTGEADHADRK
ncbi:hypothetical protein ICNINCKA_01268 [Synechococcus sp. CBW1107]|nr:hypothetical protein ICNINCKA_01268 [Synechococcus sp. CBW1107]